LSLAGADVSLKGTWEIGMDLDEIILASNFDDGDRDVATSGLCGTFALALKKVVPDVKLALLCWTTSEPAIKPWWRHVVAIYKDRLYDVDGEVELRDIVDNYCWDNPERLGGHLLEIEEDSLRALLQSDLKSWDDEYFVLWANKLTDVVVNSPYRSAETAADFVYPSAIATRK
jgi:hypothetical protein